MRDLWVKIAHTSSAKIYELIAALVALAVTARMLGPEGRGVVAAVTTWVGLFSTVGYLSLGQVALHRATDNRDSAWLAPTLGSLLFLTAIITLGGWVIAFGMYWFSGGSLFNNLAPPLLVLGYLSLPLLIWQQYGTPLLIACDRIEIVNRAQIIGRTLSFGILLVMLLWFGLGIIGVLIAMLIGQTIVAVAGMRYLYSQARGSIWPNWTTIKELLKGGIQLHLTAIGGLLVASTDVLLIHHYFGAAETGYYQLANQLTAIMLVIPQAASLVLFSKTAQMGTDGVWNYQRRTLLVLTLGMIGIASIAAVLAPFAIPLVLGQAFTPSVGVFQLLLLAVICMSFTTVMTNQWICRGLFWQCSAITLTIGVANLVANLIFIPTYGMYGGAWATVGAYVIGILPHLWMVIWCESRQKSLRTLEGSPS